MRCVPPVQGGTECHHVHREGGVPPSASSSKRKPKRGEGGTELSLVRWVREALAARGKVKRLLCTCIANHDIVDDPVVRANRCGA